jgi:DNA-binding response OmpR family regulator
MVLERGGHEVAVATDGDAGLATAERISPDLIILDLLLPKLDGLQVCRTLRQSSQVPILILTGMADEMDKVHGLEAGADDYLTKPFGPWELLARIDALLRRGQMTPSRQTANPAPVEGEFGQLRIEKLELDLVAREVRLDGRPLALKPKELDLLAFLMAHPGQCFTPGELLARVWGYREGVDTRTVDVHVCRLRAKLAIGTSSSKLIQTIRGQGYRFVVSPTTQ